jgi:predicted RNA-binding Zn ribbon-like protein
MARLAADAMALVTGPEAESLAPCLAHGCTRWFVRTHAARQWCSNRCGDRVRAARHYARAKQT